MLVSYMVWTDDVEERLKRARKAWWMTKKSVYLKEMSSESGGGKCGGDFVI